MHAGGAANAEPGELALTEPPTVRQRRIVGEVGQGSVEIEDHDWKARRRLLRVRGRADGHSHQRKGNECRSNVARQPNELEPHEQSHEGGRIVPTR
ncbi:MAG: hypothetical protein A3H95_07690 [Acidobacteria bacterium RIFCSPLOWO2_02_FULL_64_15]|nr:MAG: hypothetical protein A3H95_07690 [Acidobacteria bacterium RIFCSPLOWO2_02_FULL_64_15]